jgi:uncharacterized membrane protein YozB (DUF420 family)
LNQDHRIRLGGLFFIVCGAVLGYLSIWTPYKEALAGSQSLVLNRGGIALAILFPLMGVVLIVGGEAAADHFKAHTKPGQRTVRGWVYVAIIGAIALGVFYAVQHKFETMGYTG